MGHTHTASEWVASLFLGLIPLGAIGFVLAFAEADAAYFDPRRLLDTHTGARLIVAFLDAKTTVREAVHASAEAWRDLVALIVLLTTSPKGAMA